MDYLLTGTVRWEKARGRQPRAGEPRADPGLDRLDQVAAAVRRDAHRRLPGAGRRGRTGGAGARRGARHGRSRQSWRSGRRRTRRPTTPTSRARRPCRIGAGRCLADAGRPSAYFEQAVALDSAFALAWAQLSRAHSLLYVNGTPSPASDRRAREGGRAGARSWRRTSRPATSRWGTTTRASRSTRIARARRTRRVSGWPPTTRTCSGPARWSRSAPGSGRRRWPTSPGPQALDPRSVTIARRLAYTLLRLRRYPEALAACDRGLALAPENAGHDRDQGHGHARPGRSRRRARRVVSEAAARHRPDRRGGPLRQLLRALLGPGRPSSATCCSGSRRPRSATAPRGPSCWRRRTALQGDRARTRAYCGLGRWRPSTSGFAAPPDDAQSHVFRGLALAYLGRKAEAIAEGEQGRRAAADHDQDTYLGPYIQHQLVRIYIEAGEPEKALDRLEPLLRMPYYLSPAGSGSIRRSIRCGPTRDSRSWSRARRERGLVRRARGGARRPLHGRARARPRRAWPRSTSRSDLRHDRPVALKVLHPELAASLGPERFQREIQLAARLQHPHILTVLRLGRGRPGRLWFTMPFVEGESLRDRLRAREAAPGRRRAPDRARGGRRAGLRPPARRDPPRHQAGEHPARSDGHALVADFGIARALRSRRRAADRDRHGGRHAGLHEPGAGRRASATLDAPDRHLLARLRAVRDAGGRAAVHRADGAGDDRRGGSPSEAPSVRQCRPSGAGVGGPGGAEGAGAGAGGPVRVGAASWRGRSRRRPPRPAPAAAPATAVTSATANAARPRTARPCSSARDSSSASACCSAGSGATARRRPAAPAATSSAWRCSRSRTSARRTTSTSPTASPTRSGASSPSIPGLQVTASRSAAEYKKSGKDLATIARELGVDYLLVGKVRWEKGDAATEPGAGEPRADPGGHRLDQVGAAVRRQPDRRVPGAGGRGRPGGAGARRGARGGREGGAGASGRRRTSRRTTPTSRARKSRGASTWPTRRRCGGRWCTTSRRSRSTRLSPRPGPRAPGRTPCCTPTASPTRPSRRRRCESAERARALAPERPEGYLALAEYYRNVTADAAPSAGAGGAGARDRADRCQPARGRRPGAAAARDAGTRPASCSPRRRRSIRAPSSPAGGSRGACSSAGTTPRRPRPASERSRSIRRISACWRLAP